MAIEIADPRDFSAKADARFEPLIGLAEACLSALSASRAEEFQQKLARALAERMRGGDAATLATVLSASPTAAVARQLWRGMIDGWRVASEPATGDRVVATLFALPLVIVAGRTAGDTKSGPTALAATLADAGPVNALLREHRALGGNLSFSLAESLVAAEAIDVASLPTLLTWQELSSGAVAGERALHPAPMSIHPNQESVHLRFLLGTAIGAPSMDLFNSPSGGEWLMALAQELSRQLASAGASVLALPRPPQAPLLALQHGQAAQREVGAQIFASNAIRRFRAGVGEPSAVISAHRCAAAPGGGELRLSLSSPFDPRQAEGFRCPLFPFDRAGDVATMLIELLHDCRLRDIRVVEGVQGDRDPSTGMTILFKADAIPGGETVVLH